MEHIERIDRIEIKGNLRGWVIFRDNWISKYDQHLTSTISGITHKICKLQIIKEPKNWKASKLGERNISKAALKLDPICLYNDEFIVEPRKFN